MEAIRIGKQRIVLDNVTHVDERTSEYLYKRPDGSFAEDFYGGGADEFVSGLVVTVCFISTSESPDYVKFYQQDAEDFLKRFDERTIYQIR